MTTAQLRFLFYAPPGRVNRQEHIIYGTSLMQAVEALGHGLMIDTKTLDQFVALASQQPHGIKSRFAHPGLSADGLGKFLGRIHNTRHGTNNNVIGDLHLSPAAAKSPSGDLRGYVEELAATDPLAFGMSASVTGDAVWVLENGAEIASERGSDRPENATTEYPVLRLSEIHAVDAVDEPAANRDGLFSSAFNRTTSQVSEAIYKQLDEALYSFGITADKLPALLPQLLSDLETGQPSTPLASHIATLVSEYDVDMSKARDFAYRYTQARQVTTPTKTTGQITLSRHTRERNYQPINGGLTMSEMTQVPTGLWQTVEGKIKEMFSKSTPDPDQQPTPPPQVETVQLSAVLDKERDELSAQVATYKAQVEKLEAEQARAAKVSRFANDFKGTVFSDDDELHTILAGLPEEQAVFFSAKFKAVSAQANLTTVTEKVGGTGTPEGTQEETLHTATIKYSIDNKTDYATAFNAVSLLRPELVEKWQRGGK